MPTEDLQLESFATFVLLGQLVLSGFMQNIVNDILPKVGYPEKDSPKIVEVQRRPPNLSPGAEAFHMPNDDRVYILTDTDVYKSAKSGNSQAIIKLASIIAHENEHAKGGGEKEAYDAQIKTLRRLNASSEMIQGVQRARDMVLKSGKR